MNNPQSFDRGMLPDDSSLSRIARGEEKTLEEIKSVIDESNDPRVAEWHQQETQGIKVKPNRLINWSALRELTKENPALRNQIAALAKDFRDAIQPIVSVVPELEPEAGSTRVGIIDNRAKARLRKNPIYRGLEKLRQAS